MNKFTKTLLFIFGLVSLLLSVLLLDQQLLNPFLANLRESFPLLFTITAYFTLVLCVLFLGLMLYALFVPTLSNVLILKRDKGRLQFSRKTIESTARHSFADVAGVTVVVIKARIRKSSELSRVFVKLSMTSTQELAAVTELVQRRIEEAIENSLGIQAKSVVIRVAEASGTASSIATPVSRVDAPLLPAPAAEDPLADLETPELPEIPVSRVE